MLPESQRSWRLIDSPSSPVLSGAGEVVTSGAVFAGSLGSLPRRRP
jgi:hypothetical protein